MFYSIIDDLIVRTLTIILEIFFHIGFVLCHEIPCRLFSVSVSRLPDVMAKLAGRSPQHVSCKDSHCRFLQGTGVTGWQVMASAKTLYWDLLSILRQKQERTMYERNRRWSEQLTSRNGFTMVYLFPATDLPIHAFTYGWHKHLGCKLTLALMLLHEFMTGWHQHIYPHLFKLFTTTNLRTRSLNMLQHQSQSFCSEAVATGVGSKCLQLLWGLLSAGDD